MYERMKEWEKEQERGRLREHEGERMGEREMKIKT